MLCWKIAVSAQRGLGAYHRALEWLDRASVALPAARIGLAARLLSTRSFCLTLLGRFGEAAAAAEEAVGLAREAGDKSLEAYSLSMVGIAMNSQGRLRSALECDAVATDLYERIGDLAGQAISQANLAGDYLLLGDLRSSLHHSEVSLAVSARIGDIDGMAVQHLNIGATLVQMGDLEEAVLHLQQAVELQERHRLSPTIAGYALIQLAKTRILSGDLMVRNRHSFRAVNCSTRTTTSPCFWMRAWLRRSSSSPRVVSTRRRARVSGLRLRRSRAMRTRLTRRPCVCSAAS